MGNYVNLWEPPDADPHVRWCERSGACRPLLLDHCLLSFNKNCCIDVNITALGYYAANFVAFLNETSVTDEATVTALTVDLRTAKRFCGMRVKDNAMSFKK